MEKTVKSKEKYMKSVLIPYSYQLINQTKKPKKIIIIDFKFILCID